MPASDTHNEWVLRPIPGARFTLWQSDVRLQFQRGREKEVVEHLRAWLDYLESTYSGTQKSAPIPTVAGVVDPTKEGNSGITPDAAQFAHYENKIVKLEEEVAIYRRELLQAVERKAGPSKLETAMHEKIVVCAGLLRGWAIRIEQAKDRIDLTEATKDMKSYAASLVSDAQLITDAFGRQQTPDMATSTAYVEAVNEKKEKVAFIVGTVSDPLRAVVVSLGEAQARVTSKIARHMQLLLGHAADALDSMGGASEEIEASTYVVTDSGEFQELIADTGITIAGGKREAPTGKHETVPAENKP